MNSALALINLVCFYFGWLERIVQNNVLVWKLLSSKFSAKIYFPPVDDAQHLAKWIRARGNRLLNVDEDQGCVTINSFKYGFRHDNGSFVRIETLKWYTGTLLVKLEESIVIGASILQCRSCVFNECPSARG